MDEKSANLCRIAMRVQQRILASGPMVAAVERLALAPATTTNDLRPGFRVPCSTALRKIGAGFRNDIRSVGDELAINAKYGFERALDLRRRVVLRL